MSTTAKSVDAWDGHVHLALVAISTALLLAPTPSSLPLAHVLSLTSGRELWDGRIFFALAVASTPLLLTLHPKSPVRRILYWVPLLLLFLAYRAPLGDKAAAYQFGILLASWTMRILDRLYLNDPEATFRYKEDGGGGPVTYTPLQKLAWAVELMVVTRGVGWNWQIKQIPPQPQQLSRQAFLLQKAGSAVFKVGVLYMIRIASAALLQLSGEDVNNACAGLLLHPACLHVFMYASWAFVVYSSLDLAENISAMVFVGLGITKRWSQPAMWPSVFGDIRDSYSIRRSWGLFWHQNMRRVCQSPGNFLVRQIPSLRQPKTQLTRLTNRYLRLLLTFVFSGFIHAGGSIYMTQRQASVHDGGNVIGFIYQGLALVAEDAILSLLGIDDTQAASLARRLVGYTLVHGYAAYATPTLKVMPLARDHGLEGSLLMAGVKMVGLGAQGVLKNPFATLVGSFNV